MVVGVKRVSVSSELTDDDDPFNDNVPTLMLTLQFYQCLLIDKQYSL